MKKVYAGGILYNPSTKAVLLHKRDGNTTANPHKWAFFGGLAEGDETPLEAFVREMEEELGIKISTNEVRPLDDYLNVERGTYRYLFYVLSDKKKSEMILTEGADFDWIPLEKVFGYDLTDKTVRDLKTFLNLKKL